MAIYADNVITIKDGLRKFSHAREVQLEIDKMEAEVLNDVKDIIANFSEMAKHDVRIQAGLVFLLSHQWKKLHDEFNARPEQAIFMKLVKSVDVLYRTALQDGRFKKLAEHLTQYSIARNATNIAAYKPSFIGYTSSNQYKASKLRLLNHLTKLKNVFGHQVDESRTKARFEEILSYVKPLPEYKKVKRVLKNLGIDVEDYMPVIRMEVFVTAAAGKSLSESEEEEEAEESSSDMVE